MMWTTLAWALPAQGPAATAYEAHVDVMERVARAARDATWTFHKQERWNGRWLAKELMEVKHRLPNDFYVKWVGDEYQNREVLYRPGWNDDELLINASALLPNVSVSPTGSVAMDKNRHPIPDLSVVRVALRIVSDVELVRQADWAPQVQDLGPRTVFGEASHCYHTVSRKDLAPALYGTESELCFSSRTKMPLTIKTWDIENGELVLVEEYGWQDLQLNVGLTDTDFDPEADAYGF